MPVYENQGDQVGVWLELPLVNQDRRVMEEKRFLLEPQKARELAQEIVKEASKSGLDLNQTLRINLRLIQNMINGLFDSIKNSRSKEDVQRLSIELQALLELAQYLNRIYRSPHGVSEGALHIVKHISPEPQRQEAYSVIFSSYLGTGGAASPRVFFDRNHLQQFLLDEIRVDGEAVAQALRDLEARRVASIPSIVLTNDQLDQLGF